MKHHLTPKNWWVHQCWLESAGGQNPSLKKCWKWFKHLKSHWYFGTEMYCAPNGLIRQEINKIYPKNKNKNLYKTPLTHSNFYQRGCSVITQISKSVTRSLKFNPRGPQRGNSIDLIKLLFGTMTFIDFTLKYNI